LAKRRVGDRLIEAKAEKKQSSTTTLQAVMRGHRERTLIDGVVMIRAEYELVRVCSLTPGFDSNWFVAALAGCTGIAQDCICLLACNQSLVREKSVQVSLDIVSSVHAVDETSKACIGATEKQLGSHMVLDSNAFVLDAPPQRRTLMKIHVEYKLQVASGTFDLNRFVPALSSCTGVLMDRVHICSYDESMINPQTFLVFVDLITHAQFAHHVARDCAQPPDMFLGPYPVIDQKVEICELPDASVIDNTPPSSPMKVSFSVRRCNLGNTPHMRAELAENVAAKCMLPKHDVELLAASDDSAELSIVSHHKGAVAFLLDGFSGTVLGDHSISKVTYPQPEVSFLK